MNQGIDRSVPSPGIASLPNWVTASVLVIGVVILWALANLFINLFVGRQSTATVYIGIVTGTSTIALLILTGWYATETQKLVRVSERARVDEQQRNKRRREEEIDSLRRALLGEIKSIEGIEEYAEIYSPPLSRRYDLIPTEIYEANAGGIGRLNPHEIEAVLDYYGTVKMLENALRIQRLKDTTAGKDAIQQYFIGSKYVLDEIVRWLTHGYITPQQRDIRTEHVREQFKDLAEAQKDAISELKDSHSS